MAAKDTNVHLQRWVRRTYRAPCADNGCQLSSIGISGRPSVSQKPRDAVFQPKTFRSAAQPDRRSQEFCVGLANAVPPYTPEIQTRQSSNTLRRRRDKVHTESRVHPEFTSLWKTSLQDRLLYLFSEWVFVLSRLATMQQILKYSIKQLTFPHDFLLAGNT
jgi:hypothetical protein